MATEIIKNWDRVSSLTPIDELNLETSIATALAAKDAENQQQRVLLVELRMWLAWCGSHARMGIARGDKVAIQFLQDIAKWSEEKASTSAVMELMKKSTTVSESQEFIPNDDAEHHYEDGEEE